MSRSISPKAHHVNVCDKAVRLWRKGVSYEKFPLHVNDEGRGKLQTRHSWWTNEVSGALRIIRTEKVYVSRNGKKEEKKVGWVVWNRRTSAGCRTLA